MDETERTLQDCLRRQLPVFAAGEAIDMSVNLQKVGLDSMSAVALLVDVENSLGITIPKEMLRFETCRTGGVLLATVRTILRDQASTGR
jgi:acyl carrier protein